MSEAPRRPERPAAIVVRSADVPPWRLACVGTVTAGFGLAMLNWPDVARGLLPMPAGVALLAVAGLAALLGGCAAMFQGALARGRERVGGLGRGAGTILAGAALLAWPGPVLHALVLLAGVGITAVGGAEIAMAVRGRRRSPGAGDERAAARDDAGRVGANPG